MVFPTNAPQGKRLTFREAQRRGLEVATKLVVGDGAMGFWAARHEVYGQTRVQRCWVHKTANVLNVFAQVGPAQSQSAAEGHLDGRNQTRRRCCL